MRDKITGIIIIAICSYGAYVANEPALAALGLILGSLYYFGKIAK